MKLYLTQVQEYVVANQGGMSKKKKKENDKGRVSLGSSSSGSSGGSSSSSSGSSSGMVVAVQSSTPGAPVAIQGDTPSSSSSGGSGETSLHIDTATDAPSSSNRDGQRSSPRQVGLVQPVAEVVSLESILGAALSKKDFSGDEGDEQDGGGGLSRASCMHADTFSYYFECLQSNHEGMAEVHEPMWPPQLNFHAAASSS